MPQKVAFVKDAAVRIAKVVRLVETGDRSSSGAEWGVRFDGTSGKVFRVCTFDTASWSINGTKTVTFKYQTTTPNTVSATNLFANIGTATGTRNCAIAREGTSWFLIAAQCP